MGIHTALNHRSRATPRAVSGRTTNTAGSRSRFTAGGRYGGNPLFASLRDGPIPVAGTRRIRWQPGWQGPPRSLP